MATTTFAGSFASALYGLAGSATRQSGLQGLGSLIGQQNEYYRSIVDQARLNLDVYSGVVDPPKDNPRLKQHTYRDELQAEIDEWLG